ncbi:MAG: sigma-54-dependent Fis family transcriptional regulator [candidate division NC10 bacterium]|nr:sigma-54-dependent Fis family transcriptional regulator [candidate division NC10 bacterium]
MPSESPPRDRILIVDDEENVLHFLSRVLEDEGYGVETARTAAEVRTRDWEVPLDLAIIDLRLQPGEDGISLLQMVRERAPETSAVLMTAYGSIESAVAAMRAGAYDYVTKPFRAEEILKVVAKALEQRRLQREVWRLRREVERRYSFANLIGKSPAMQELFHQIEQVAASRGTVLVSGESGTGKELVARAIHYNSPRRSGPFVVIDCAAIPETLQESELFGHAKGAFTGAVGIKRGLFEEADGGTLFLDEVGELRPPTQATLLRVLQDGSFRRVGDTRTLRVDVRVIAATNKDLAEAVRTGQFREDLFYRLKVVPIHLPPLRERREDIPLLADHFLQHSVAQARAEVRRITPQGLDLLLRYPWPGNVRELENTIERALLFCDGEAIGPEHLPPEVRQSTEAIRVGLPHDSLDLRLALDRAGREVESDLIRRALDRSRGNRTQAARLLGISRRALLYKLKEMAGQTRGEPIPNGKWKTDSRQLTADHDRASQERGQ